MPYISKIRKERSGRPSNKSADEVQQRQNREEAAKMHAQAIGALDFETIRVQALGAKKMREEAWLAEYRSSIRVSTLEWRPIVPKCVREYLRRGMHMRKLVAAILMRRAFRL